jgi:glucose dehydrogenase
MARIAARRSACVGGRCYPPKAYLALRRRGVRWPRLTCLRVTCAGRCHSGICRRSIRRARSLAIGMWNSGGPLVTAGGVIFIGASMDKYFRAIDTESGQEIWRTKLPRAAIATPMTYAAADGRQIVVIAAGGHGKAKLETGDYVVAFALPASK